MLERRGFKVRRLSAGEGTPPSLYGELLVPGAKRTLMFYAHYDGQPVDQKGWLSDPFKPVLRTGPLGRPGKGRSEGPRSAKVAGPLDPEWRIYARSASDDKSPIVAILTALDALRAGGRQPSVNVKLFLEGRGGAGLGPPAGDPAPQRSPARRRRLAPLRRPRAADAQDAGLLRRPRRGRPRADRLRPAPPPAQRPLRQLGAQPGRVAGPSRGEPARRGGAHPDPRLLRRRPAAHRGREARRRRHARRRGEAGGRARPRPHRRATAPVSRSA